MLPPAAAVESVEAVRDGGSLAAVFLGPNGARHGLHNEKKLYMEELARHAASA